jgi:hypothetical protein
MRIGLGSRRLTDQELVAVLHRVYHPSIPDYRVPPTLRIRSLVAPTDTDISLPTSDITPP